MGAMLGCCEPKVHRVTSFNDYVVDILSSTLLGQFSFKQMYKLLFDVDYSPTTQPHEGNKKLMSLTDFFQISSKLYPKSSPYSKIHQQLFTNIAELLAFDNKISCEKIIILFLSLLSDTDSEKIVYFHYLIEPYCKEKIGEQNYYINNRVKFFFRAYLDYNLIFFNKVIFGTLYSTFHQEKDFLTYFVNWFHRCKIENMRKFTASISPHFDPTSNFMTTSMIYYLNVFTENRNLFNFYELRNIYQGQFIDTDAGLMTSKFNYNDLEDKEYSTGVLMKAINNVHLKVEVPETEKQKKEREEKEQKDKETSKEKV